MKAKIFEGIKEVDLHSLRIGPVEMFLCYSVYDDESSDIEIRELDENGDIYGVEIIVQDRYGYEAYKKVCSLFSEREATKTEEHDYQTFFVISFAGGEYRDGTRGKIQDALYLMYDKFLRKN